MKQRVLHTASLLLLVAIAFQCLVSCVYDYIDDGDGDWDDDGKAVLVVRTASLDSRSAMSDMEKLHSLRVIILHANGALEENYYVSDLGGAERHEHIFRVSGKETKKIYLVANEGSMTGVDLNNLGTAPAETLEQITFDAVPSESSENPVFANGIPMSACYELTIGSESRIEKDFFLVRTMTKFTFTFQNIRTDNVTLKDMRVSAFADKTYLFPQFTDGNSVKVNSGNFLVDAVGDYVPEAGQFWIDWLKEAVDKSQTGLYTPDEIGWIKNYHVPSDAVHDNPDTEIALDFSEIPSIKSGETFTYPGAYYRCESINTRDGKEQEYSISYLKVRADRDESDTEWRNKPVLKLNQVRYLFRHTHVEVNLVLGQEDVVIFARIHPWIVIKPTAPLPMVPED